MILAIIKKELKRVFTDKRLIISLFILPAISLFATYALLGRLSASMMSNINEHIPIVYVQNSPESFNNYYNSIEKNNIKIKYINGEDISTIKDSIKKGTVDLLVSFDVDFDNKIASYKSESKLPEIKTFYNPSEDYSNKSRKQFLSSVLEPYETDILTKRFENINYTKAFSIDATNSEGVIVDKNKQKGKMLSMILPMLIGIILFSSTMGVGMESIAGEKERGTMANLLLAPISRNSIAYGKMAGLGIIAIISALCSFIGVAISVPFASSIIPVGGGLPQFSIMQFIQLLLIMITLVGINVGLVCLISVKAKTVKEAATYVTPVFMIVMLASFSTMFGSSEISSYKYAIPVYGSIASIKAILNFNLDMQSFLFTIGSSLLTAFVLTKAITYSFKNENTMFNA
ncbi:ABC transporter permease subunit [Clostridiaceae bacterium M8S5]|nr:ABC transporter permease subunit [Clostridiaceae bacterium M8S5]